MPAVPDPTVAAPGPVDPAATQGLGRTLSIGLAAVTVLLLAALWLAVFGLLEGERDAILRAEGVRNENLALAHELQLVASLRLIEDKLDDLRREYRHHGLQLDLAEQVGDSIGIKPHLVSLLVIDAQGNTKVSWPATMARANYADRDYFIAQRDAQADRMFVGTPVLGRVTGRWLLTLSKRLHGADGSFQGVVTIAVDPAFFTTLYGSTDLGVRGSLAMIGLDGVTRVRRNGAEVSFGQNVAASQLFTELKQRPTGRYTARAASDGVLRMVGYRRMADYPLVAVVGSSVEEALAPLQLRRRLYVSAATLVSALMAGIGWLVWRQMRRDRQLIAAIRAGEQRYRLVFEHDLAGIIRMRPDGRILETNPALRRMFGLGEAALRQRGAYALVDPADRRIDRLREQRDRHGSALGELRALRADGQVFDVEATSVNYVDESGEPGVLVVMRDITERKQLQREQQKLQEVLDASPDFIGVAGVDGQVQFLNAAGRRMLGVAADALPSRAADSHPAWAWQMLRDTGIPTAIAHGSWTGETAIRLADGRELPVLQTVVCHRDAEGRPTQLSTVAKDITPLKEAEAARRATAVAEQANRAKSEFMSRMSHELRTPLNAILGFSQLLQSDRKSPLPPAKAAQVGHILQAGRHLLSLIDDLLDLSRLEAGTLRVTLQPVDLVALAQASVVECGAMAAASRVDLVVDTDGAPAIWAEGDPTRVRQVLCNLISNAIKYGREGGRVTVRLRAAPGRAEAAVVDQGDGLSDAQMQRLFQPFERLGFEQSRIKGTGIGLVIARALAELMGGTLQAASRPGVGSTFTLSMAGSQPSPHAVVPATMGQRQDPPLRTARLLYVDDSEVNRMLMADLIGRHPTLTLDLATDGAEGLAMARSQPPDLLLADIRMPGMDGFEFLRRLREVPALAGIPVIAVSAHALPREIERARDAGFCAYVTKPIDAGLLLEEIARRLPA